MKLRGATARTTAAAILCQLYSTRKPVKAIFDETIEQTGLLPRDRNLTMQLVYGVLRQRQRLDRIISLLSSTKLKKLDPFLHQTLAVGMLQLLFLDRIPASAAVNEAVNSLKWQGKPKRLQGFCNGVLRETIRQKDHLLQQSITDAAGSAITNHPKWLTKRWQKFWGEEETSRICRVNNTEPCTVLRINLSRVTLETVENSLTAAGVSCQRGMYSKSALVLTDFHGSVASLPGFAEGWFGVQDEAAQLATSLLQPIRQKGRYLDGCAGLGGKTSHLLDLTASEEALITAVEPESYRLRKLGENLERLFPGRPVTIHEGTLATLMECNQHKFHGILIDAPCSGTGVIHRHPDIRWNREPQDLHTYQQRQLELLATAAQMLLPGGILVYATCSLEPEENHEIIAKFCRSHAGFELTDCRPFLPESAHKFVVGNCFAPHPDAAIDGFFAARLMLQQGGR